MALLLAALAVEVGAGEALDEWLGARLAARPSPAGVIPRASSNGATVLADPIYEVLVAKGSFKNLLHERPLHFTGRSLLLQDERLYDGALRLYTTWNKIAPTGEPSTAACFGLTRGDARSALDIAAAVLVFFGRLLKVATPRTTVCRRSLRGCGRRSRSCSGRGRSSCSARATARRSRRGSSA